MTVHLAQRITGGFGSVGYSRQGGQRREWISHGPLTVLNPFGSADGVVARAASRLVTVSRGLDPHALGVPEVMWMRQSGRYRELSSAFAAGTPEAIAAWIIFCCQALTAGAAEATSIADSAKR